MMAKNKSQPTRRRDFNLSDHVAVVKKADERVVGFAESERQGVTASADQQPDGRVSLLLSGASPQGEEDTFAACRILIETMNRAGASWSQPVLGREPADCEANDSRLLLKPLEIQVVRATNDPILWKSLSNSGAIQRLNAPVDFVPMVRSAVAKKLKYPRDERARLVLALDANRLPDVTIHDVVDHIRTELKDWLSELGFREVWLVGPVCDLTHRLFP
jgi:hypothetical protein